MTKSLAIYHAGPDPYGKTVGFRPNQKIYYRRQNQILWMAAVMMEFMSKLPKEAQDHVCVIMHPSEINFRWQNPKGLGEGIYVELGVTSPEEGKPLIHGIALDYRNPEKDKFIAKLSKYDVKDPIPQAILDAILLAIKVNNVDEDIS